MRHDLGNPRSVWEVSGRHGLGFNGLRHRRRAGLSPDMVDEVTALDIQWLKEHSPIFTRMSADAKARQQDEERYRAKPGYESNPSGREQAGVKTP